MADATDTASGVVDVRKLLTFRPRYANIMSDISYVTYKDL